jgi:hypothetical protein
VVYPERSLHNKEVQIMSYSSYKDPTWKVTSADPDSRCQPGDQIKFEGPTDKVIISCNGKAHYLPGVYKDEINAIERSNHYVIHMTPPIVVPPAPPFQTLIFTPTDSSRTSGGSWTADDSIPPERAEG